LWQSSHELSAAVHELVQIKKKQQKTSPRYSKQIFITTTDSNYRHTSNAIGSSSSSSSS